jgi:hypothetical protein
MFQTCHHVMPGGLRCQSPAMRGHAFCYHHARRAAAHQANPAEARIQIPAKLDRAGIPQALRQVMNALANNQISARRASILCYGLQMAVDHPDTPGPAPAQIQPNPIDLARLSSAIGDLLRQKKAE